MLADGFRWWRRSDYLFGAVLTAGRETKDYAQIGGYMRGLLGRLATFRDRRLAAS